MLLKEIKAIDYVPPDLEFEFNEVEHQTELKSFFKTKKNWKAIVSRGKSVVLTKTQLDSLNNHDPNFKNLDDDKQERVKTLFASGKVEMPIVLQDDDFMHLVSGNTRLAFARKHKFPAQVWLVRVPGLEEYF